jgi:anaerobic selenocysteine-containing dehydrogenase
VVFEPRGSLTAGNADEWIPIRPGSDAILALGLTRLIAEERGVPVPPAAQSVTAQAAAQAADIGEGKLRELAALFAASTAPLAIPGGAALGQPDGLLAAQAVLELNALAGNLGQPGGVFLPQEESPASDLNAVADLVERMNSGQVKALFIHGVNPIFELPSALGFSQALANIPLVISFASFPDETALASDYILPDHTPLESFGYQRILAGTDRPTVSAIQPVVAPLYETRATADVLLEAARQVGGSVADSLNYGVEVTFIQQKIAHLIEDGGLFTAPEVLTFWTRWLQNGGWWTQDAALETPELAEGLDEAARPAQLTALQDDNQFYVITYPNHFGDGSVANRPWIQELPDTSTTVTWNSWVEINPATADRLGIQDDDIVSITTEYGSLEAIVYRFPAIRPDTIALPFGQGHTALGRWAEGRGSNPAVLMPTAVNTAGDQAFGSLLATISPTGRRRPLARVESRLGVYGEH